MTQISENDLACQPDQQPPIDYWVERVESLKAGGLGAIAALFLCGLTLVVNHWIEAVFATIEGLPPFGLGWQTLGSGAISLLSGFLFAVTYRYIIRQDNNQHLKAGAVAAFGLVRGLAQLDIGLQAQVAPLALAILVLESLLLFAGARGLLDWAIGNHWIKPFPGAEH